MVNSATGTITGGDASGGQAGTAVNLTATVTGGVVNAGTIRGGADLSGGGAGGVGIRVQAGTPTVTNSGLIEG
ncbi:hypothetical protein AB4142_34660, partial [Variovorax sp. 2RAF20]